ncbi:hypothetical protein [Amphiplicatus metriothermophilus]|uniref:hypothetical protein n=1 Tax=Amphiplicatus metriothermophilus TaxID=1519374 RepID=UPI001177A286|nr:hypothetical protein [Amphiplicatus metriothermophilus]MBB5518940.1 hypothetical protein [Amphiplicatus metriothermophilus]
MPRISTRRSPNSKPLNAFIELNKLEKTAKKSDIDEYRKGIILAACAHMRKLNDRRNDYAHGLFEHTKDGAVRLRPFGINDAPQILEPARVEGDIMLLDIMFHMARFVAGRITREQLQPYMDRLTSAKVDPHDLQGA